MKDRNELKAGTILSYIQMIIGVVIGVVYTPIMIRLLGQSEYGLYNTATSTISLLSVLNLGFSSGYIKYYSKYKAENDNLGIAKLNGLFLIIFSILGLITLFCGLVLTNNLQYVFKTGLTPEEYSIAKILMLLLTLNLAISFPMGVFAHIITAHERFVTLKLLGIGKSIVSPLITLPLLLLGYGSIAMVVVTVIVSLIVDITYLFYTKVILKQKFVFHDFEKGIFKNLFCYTSLIAINLIVDQINWNIDKILLGRFQGTKSVAIYSVGYSIFSYYMMLSTSISGVFTPRIHKVSNKAYGELAQKRMFYGEIFIKVGRIQFLLLGLIFTGFLFFGKSFVDFWAGYGYQESYYVALLLMGAASISLVQTIGIEVQRAENQHWFRSLVYSVMAMFNLILSIFLCKYYGAVGSAIGTAVALLLANGLVMNIYYQKQCNIDIITFWKNILRMSIGMIIPIVCGILMMRFIYIQSIWGLLGCVLIYASIYTISMWFLGINQYEKNLIKKPLKKVFKKVKENE